MSEVKFVPLNDYVLIQRDVVEETKTPGGIIVPKQGQEVPVTCTVISVGKGKDDVVMEVKAGDRVVLGKYAGTEIELDEEKYVVIRQEDIFGIVPA